ncbi:radical SAM protein [Bacteroidales bacterium OttesenSCG-928-C19]|nr:radical SAM protein [Bacteroidales bacterium OttesenSCG-928-C19]
MNKRRLKKAIQRIGKLPRNKFLILYLFNKIRHFYFKLIRSTKVAYPSTIMLELTNHCNLACSTCPREYAYGKEMDKGMMTVSQAKSVIDELWPYLDSIGLTGMGETFLYKDIEEVIDYIKSKNKGIIISVSTNAMLPNFLEIISKLIGKIDTIQISIDGLNDVYNSIRRKADFQILDKNLRELARINKGTKTDLMLNMVVTAENYFQMPLLIKYAKEIGVKYMDFSMFNLASVTDLDKSYYDFYKSSEFLEVEQEMRKTSENIKDVLVTWKSFTTDGCFQKCNLPWTHFYICWNGFVTPCCTKPFPKELNFGNVFEKGVMNVLNGKEFREFRKLWYANKTPLFCKNCHYVDA